MVKVFFHQIFFLPLYNALVFLSALLPGHDIGLAIVALTVAVKFLLLPLQWQMLRTQAKMKALEPLIKELKAKHQDDKAEQARQLMNLYREHRVNPLGGLTIFIQLPIIIALYAVFQSGFNFDPTALYSFVVAPPAVDMLFFGIFDLTAKSYILALLAGLTQMIQAQLMMPPPPSPNPAKTERSFQEDLARSMNIQVRYVLPVLVVFFSLSLPSAVAVYWITSNLFTIVAESLFRRFKTPALNQATTK
ncbi:MAG: membrane protein insertase YidC [Candidatus Vogelbacteria bacterium]|nr:membrane protein insertase YidC [Candidatus Vogelbacteria bacterium]